MRAPQRPPARLAGLPRLTPVPPAPRSLSATLGYLQRLDRNPARALELMAVLARKGESQCSADYAPDAYCAAVVETGAFPLVLAAAARARPYATKKSSGKFFEVEDTCLSLLAALLAAQGDAVPAESLAAVARLACDRLARATPVAECFAVVAAEAVQRRLALAGAPPPASALPEAAATAGTAKATLPEDPATSCSPATINVSV